MRHALPIKCFACLWFAASILQAGDTLTVFGKQWSVVNCADWKVGSTGGVEMLSLLTPRGPVPGPRRPIQFAIAQTEPFRAAQLELDARPHERSLMLVYAYRDAAHFDYAHLSIDTAAREPNHNGIFHVYNGERVRISSESGPSAFPQTNRWYHVVLVWDGATGVVQVSVDGHQIPALHAVDLSLSSGRIGFGSFDETADFKNVRLTGKQ